MSSATSNIRQGRTRLWRERQATIRFFRTVACCLSLVAVCAVAACSYAQEPDSEELHTKPEQISDQVKAELISEHASIQLGGTTRVGVLFEVEDGWHIYAEDPGDAGLPTKVSWSGSGVSFGPLQWPTPEEFLDPGDIRTHGYTGTLVLASTLHHVAWKETPDHITIHATVKWLVCKDLCVPGSAQLELTLPVSDQPPVSSTHAQFFEQVQQQCRRGPSGRSILGT